MANAIALVESIFSIEGIALSMISVVSEMICSGNKPFNEVIYPSAQRALPLASSKFVVLF